MNSKQARIARIQAKGCWICVIFYFGLYGFGMLVLPPMIRHWDAQYGAVPLAVRQFAIDASESFKRVRFTVMPTLLLLSVWMTMRARKAGN